MKCNFCGVDIPVGTGVLQAYKDGSFYTLCSRKCEVNMLRLGRKPQKAKWTQRYHEEKAIRTQGGEKAVAKVKVEKVIQKGARADRKAKREARRVEKKKGKVEHKKAKAEGKAPVKPVEAAAE